MQLQSRGCSVRIFVPDPCTNPQFTEVTQGRVPINSVATWIPRAIGGRVRVPLTLLRTAMAARSLARAGDSLDLVFCDVVPHVIRLVKRLTGLPVLYFCHFPDLLLTLPGSRRSMSYQLYRWPLDELEIDGMLSADRVVVNSHFTASVVRQCIPALPEGRMHVVHPGVPAAAVRRPASRADSNIQLLSISRFDPRKNLTLAIESLAALREIVPPRVFERVRLVLAGHHDVRLAEQRAYVQALRALAQTLQCHGACASGVFAIAGGLRRTARKQQMRPLHTAGGTFRLCAARGDGCRLPGRRSQPRRSNRDGSRRRDGSALSADTRGICRCPQDGHRGSRARRPLRAVGSGPCCTELLHRCVWRETLGRYRTAPRATVASTGTPLLLSRRSIP